MTAGDPVSGTHSPVRCVPLDERAVGHWRILSECVGKQVHSGDEDLLARRCRRIDESIDSRGIEAAFRGFIDRHDGWIHVVDDRVVLYGLTGSYPATCAAAGVE